MRRAVVVVGLLVACAASAAIGIACGDDETPATPPPGTTPDASDDTTTEPVDAGGEETSVDPGCKTAAAPSSACAADAAGCERKTLYLSPSSTFPFAIVTDATNVYWVAQSGAADSAYDGTATASIYRVAKNGAPTQAATVLAQNQSRATTLIKDGTDLYWIASEANDAGSASTLRRLSGAAGTPQDVATFSGITRRLVRVSAGVFFTVDHQGNVRRVTKDGMVSDVDKTSAAPSLAASKDSVFAGGGLVQRVDRMAAAGGPGTTFFGVPEGGPDAALSGAHVLGADCDRLFGVHDDEGAFFWSPAAAATYTATSATFADATDIISDERFVYVARRKGGGVARGSRDGAGFESLYTGEVWRLAIDDDGVYWGEHGNPRTGGSLAGNVFMQTKK